MSINTAREGHTYPSVDYHVGSEAIRQFALAVKNQHPAHHQAEAAQALGHSDIIAPPSFAVVVSQKAEAEVVKDPEVGIDFSRVVHADERFTHHSPITAGDTLAAATTLERIRIMGAGAMVTTSTEIHTEDGTHRATVTSSLLVRADDEEEN